MLLVKYNNLVKELHQGVEEVLADCPEMDPADIAVEISTEELEDQPWIETFLSSKGVSDYTGRLASDICSGNGF